MTGSDADAQQPVSEQNDVPTEEKVVTTAAPPTAKHRHRRPTRSHPQTSSADEETDTSEAEGVAIRGARRGNSSVRVVVNTAREPYPPPIKKKEADESISPKAPDDSQQVSVGEYVGYVCTGLAAGVAIAWGIAKLLK